MTSPRYAQPPIQVLEQGVVRQLTDIKTVLDYLGDKADYGRVLLSDLDLEVAFVNKVNHGLGTAVVGWRVTAQSAPAFIHEDESSSDSTYLHLLSSGDVTIDLEVW